MGNRPGSLGDGCATQSFAVVSHKGVDREARRTRGEALDAEVRSVVVGVFHEGVQCTLALVLARQWAEGEAFALDGLEPTLDLPVRLWPVRPGPAGTYAQVRALRLPYSRDARARVVREHPLRRNPEAVTPHSSGSSSTYATRVASSMAAWITVHPAPRERDLRSPGTRCPGPPSMRPSFLVSMWTRVPAETHSHDGPVDGGTGQSQHEGTPVGTPALRGPDAGDRLLLSGVGRHPGAPGAPGPAGVVREAGQSLTGEPLPPVGVRRPRDAGIGARIGDRRPGRDRVQRPGRAPGRGQPGVVNPACGDRVASGGLPCGCGVDYQHRTGRGLHLVPTLL